MKAADKGRYRLYVGIGNLIVSTLACLIGITTLVILLVTIL